MYHATYKTPSDAAESTRNTIDHLNDEASESTLDEVIENCRDLACDADLYDAAGFRKGYVAADGTYTLT